VDACCGFRLGWADGERVSFVIDPAMPATEAMPVLAVLRARFPRLRGHHFDVMCNHGTDRVQAIAAVAADSDLMLITAGCGEDPDLETVVRAAQRACTRPRVIRRLADITPDLLVNATSVGLAATLHAPPALADELTGALSGLGPLTLSRRSVPHPPGDSPNRGLRCRCARGRVSLE
jgi:4-hydroxy-3-methylbut-2-enyl diphosphate reductase